MISKPLVPVISNPSDLVISLLRSGYGANCLQRTILKNEPKRGLGDRATKRSVKHMKKEMKNYLQYIENTYQKTDIDKEKLAQELYTRIGFYQHERLVHLIVTMSFGVFFLLSLLLITVNLSFVILSVLFLVLLVPYIAHYYFLENSVQRLYTYYYFLAEKKND